MENIGKLKGDIKEERNKDGFRKLLKMKRIVGDDEILVERKGLVSVRKEEGGDKDFIRSKEEKIRIKLDCVIVDKLREDGEDIKVRIIKKFKIKEIKKDDLIVFWRDKIFKVERRIENDKEIKGGIIEMLGKLRWVEKKFFGKEKKDKECEKNEVLIGKKKIIKYGKWKKKRKKEEGEEENKKKVVVKKGNGNKRLKSYREVYVLKRGRKNIN